MSLPFGWMKDVVKYVHECWAATVEFYDFICEVDQMQMAMISDALRDLFVKK